MSPIGDEMNPIICDATETKKKFTVAISKTQAAQYQPHCSRCETLSPKMTPVAPESKTAETFSKMTRN